MEHRAHTFTKVGRHERQDRRHHQPGDERCRVRQGIATGLKLLQLLVGPPVGGHPWAREQHRRIPERTESEGKNRGHADGEKIDVSKPMQAIRSHTRPTEQASVGEPPRSMLARHRLEIVWQIGLGLSEDLDDHSAVIDRQAPVRLRRVLT